MGRCRDCQWWVPATGMRAGRVPDAERLGGCALTGVDDGVVQAETLAFAVGGEVKDTLGYAVLMTRPTFGCVQFAPPEASGD